MKSQLALELKNAGFPQLGAPTTFIEGDYTIVAYVPSLEELVDAIGSDSKKFKEELAQGWLNDKSNESRSL